MKRSKLINIYQTSKKGFLIYLHLQLPEEEKVQGSSISEKLFHGSFTK